MRILTINNNNNKNNHNNNSNRVMSSSHDNINKDSFGRFHAKMLNISSKFYQVKVSEAIKNANIERVYLNCN